MKIRVIKENEIIIIKLINNFHFDDLDDLTTLFNSFLERMPTGRYLFDMEEMPYITSAIIGKFVAFIKKVMENGAMVKFCSLRTQVVNIFEVTGLTDVFDIYDTKEKAINSFYR